MDNSQFLDQLVAEFRKNNRVNLQSDIQLIDIGVRMLLDQGEHAGRFIYLISHGCAKSTLDAMLQHGASATVIAESLSKCPDGLTRSDYLKLLLDYGATPSVIESLASSTDLLTTNATLLTSICQKDPSLIYNMLNKMPYEEIISHKDTILKYCTEYDFCNKVAIRSSKNDEWHHPRTIWFELNSKPKS